MSYTLKMYLTLPLVFSVHGFLFFDCGFIFIWKPIRGNSLRPGLTVSSSQEDFALAKYHRYYLPRSILN